MDTRNCRPVPIWRQRTRRLLLSLLCGLVLAALTQAQDQTFVVRGTFGTNWFDTGLEIPRGTLLRIAAVGEVDLGGGRLIGPGGTLKFVDAAGFPAQTRYRYGLVARLTTRLENPGASGDELFGSCQMAVAFRPRPNDS